MTDKQFSSLRTTIIGATVLISGAVLAGKIEGALLIMLLGLFLMVREPIADWFNTNYPPIDEEKEKEDESK